MALTRIRSRASSFLQPSLEEVVMVVLDPGIDWIKIGMTVHIPDGGIYEVMNISGFVHELKLKTAIAIPGQTVIANLIYPIKDDNASTTWGGELGKEW